MQYVYILISKKDKNLYVGCTSDVEKRLFQHNTGLVSATKYRTPLELMHCETFKEAKDAFEREKFLKSLWSSRFKKKLKEKYLSR